MAKTRTTRQPKASFGLVGVGELMIKGDGTTVTITTANGFVLSLMAAEARALAQRLIDETLTQP